MVFQILPSIADFFSCVFLLFWAALFERSIYGRLFLKRYFSSRYFLLRNSGLLQLPSHLNDNSHLKMFFSEIHCMIVYDYYTLLMRKISFKTQLKIIFLIKLKLSQAGKKQSFEQRYYVKITTKILLKKTNFTLVSQKKTIWEILYFPFDIPVH